jgi:DNA polymerase-3 subunit alpha
MPHAAFVHLRVHSCFSLLQSTVQLEALLARCREDAMPAVGITDRANLFDALRVSQYAAKAGVQPLVGCLLPFRSAETAGANGRLPVPVWLPLLVQHEGGYQNLPAR